MAELEKYTEDSVMMLLKHVDRQLKNDANKDIVQLKSRLNYSIGITCPPKERYKQIKDKSYLYGRGTQRESKAITCCSWVVTLPKSVSDYSTVGKDEIKILNPEAERAFFEGVNRFIAKRYGTVFYNRVHYDEAGQAHIHVYFIPLTKLDHDLVHYKTIKTHDAFKTESGRYEFRYRYKLENGEKIPLRNYAKISDSFESKISGADVLNKAELQHFHSDLAEYLKKNQIPGAEDVCNGKTAGKNISVKSMKELKTLTGLSIEELKELQLNRDQLQKIISTKDRNLIQLLRQMQQKENELIDLHKQMETKNRVICEKNNQIQSLVKDSLSHEEQLMHMKERIMHTTEQNEQLRTRCEQYQKELEEMQEYTENRNLSQIEITEDAKSSWRQNKAWGKELAWGNQERNYEIEKERS